MTDFRVNVERYIQVHKTLHGTSFSKEFVAKDLKNSFGYDIKRSTKEIERQTTNYYGLFAGRCQPFTNGHDETIQYIIRDGKIPLIILGSTDKNDEKNPLSFDIRKNLIELKYPTGVIIRGASDKESWDDWYNSIKDIIVSLGISREQITLYSHCKEEDLTDFFYNDKHYYNKHYTEIFKINNIKIKNIDAKKCDIGDIIHASNIRKSEDLAKNNLDARIYRELKDVYGWWK